MFQALSPIISLININLIFFLTQYKNVIKTSDSEHIRQIEFKIYRMASFFVGLLFFTTLTIYIGNKYLTLSLFSFIFILKLILLYLILQDINNDNKIIKYISRISLILFFIRIVILYENMS